jgi:hypothetical protein
VSSFLRDVSARPDRPERDPMGKAALFSDTPLETEAAREPKPADGRRPGTVVIECGSCGASTRVSYIDFAIDSLPFTIWFPPLRALHFNRRMTCPACAEWTWVRAHWLS